MNISGISNTSYIRNQAYNRPVKTAEDDASLSSVVRQKSLNNNATVTADSDAASVDETAKKAVRPNRQEESFGAYDFAKLYDPNKSFGINSDFTDDIDAEKTIGQLQKDELMGQYQSLTKESAPSVRATEDFAF
ncbi:MAG TPA: hypothetical protein DCQ87_06430 [Lachnospiraceae bacterium]|nr:hypothetical protein [Lachnospiraceae bacterium]MDD7665192.1 hypothetical protein [Lachnospiraceae bacterium]MDY4165078.1 hypothetical protein [Lachnospiraceae bacterium]HAP03612.1 hypothetical protein [Lachnospiraceae bacterium]